MNISEQRPGAHKDETQVLSLVCLHIGVDPDIKGTLLFSQPAAASDVNVMSSV